jgi:hypothetical protein
MGTAYNITYGGMVFVMKGQPYLRCFRNSDSEISARFRIALRVPLGSSFLPKTTVTLTFVPPMVCFT